MQTSQVGFDLIKSSEGFCPVPTPDGERMQIGHGHDIQPGERSLMLVTAAKPLTMAEADALLWSDIRKREPFLNEHVDPVCNQNQFDALMSFFYNLGSTPLLTMMHHGWLLIPKNMSAWVYTDGKISEGLKARRAREIALFTS